MTGSARTSAGIPLGVKESVRPAPRACATTGPTEPPTGDSMPALGSDSTSTSSASPHVLPVNASRLERPTDHAGYWSVIASVSETTSKITSAHAAIANGDCTTPATGAPSPVRGGAGTGGSVATKWNHAVSSRTSTVSPSSIVANP